MRPTPVMFSVCVAQDTWARVHVNGVPIHKGQFAGPLTRTGPANYLLKSGANELAVELLKTPKLHHAASPAAGRLDDAFWFELYEVTNPHATGRERVERRILARAQFPQIWDEADERVRHYPFHHKAAFDLDLPLHRPAFFDAPTVEFDCQGTPELRDAVARIHGSLDARQYDRFLDELSFKFEQGELALEGVPEQMAASKRRLFEEELIPFEPRPRPLDMSELHFEPRAGGRVAYVTRHDGGYALEAVCEKDPKVNLRTDLLFTQHQGRWRIFA